MCILLKKISQKFVYIKYSPYLCNRNQETNNTMSKENIKGTKVWVVMENCRTKHSDETTDCVGVFASKEDAEKAIAECKEDVNNDWYGEDAFFEDEDGNIILNEEDWEIEDDEPLSYTIHRNDYEYYYSVTATQYTIK